EEPHRHLVALLDRFATELEIRKCGASQVQHRCVPADDFRYQTRHQLGVLPQLLILLWELREAQTPPDIELRVVSLPPTINRLQVASSSRKSMFRIASECASIEIRSKRGAWALARSSHRAFIAVAIFCSSAQRSASNGPARRACRRDIP